MKLKVFSYHLLSIMTLLICFLMLCHVANSQTEKPSSINLSGVADYSSEFAFTDIFKMSREWITFNENGTGPWDTQRQIPVNERGYPLSIPFNAAGFPAQQIRTLLLWDIEGHYPSGQYRLIVEGSGRVSMALAANGTWDTPCDVLVPVTASDAGIILTIESSSPADPITDIKFILPDYTDNYQEKTFTDQFMDFVGDFDNIRFMDWTETNFSPVRSWSDRTPADFYTQSLHSGVAWEYVIQLANESGKDPWINIPHQADDDFITRLATLFRDELDPALTLYLEYSNEVWNGIFSQASYASDQAATLGFSGNEFERAMKYTVRRSADVFHIFEEVFGGKERLYHVLPSWIATDGWYSNELLNLMSQSLYNPHGVQPDGLAVAPYFGGEVADQIAESGQVNSISIDEIIERLDSSMDWVFNQVQINKEICEENNIELIAYEGGQHLVGNWPHVENNELTEKLIAANRHPGMYDLYCKYTDFWYNTANGGLFSFFSSHNLPSKWGSWGIKEHMDDLNNPKYRAIIECVLNTGSTSVPENSVKSEIVFSPNPVIDRLFIQNLEESMLWTVFSICGKPCLSGMGPELLVSDLMPGMYILKVQGQVAKFVKQ